MTSSICVSKKGGITMSYIAITGIQEKNIAHAVVITDDFNRMERDLGWIPLSTSILLEPSFTPVNYKVVNGAVQAACGDFGRFSRLGSAVVLAEVKTKGGKTIGYRLLSCATNVITNLKTEDILAREKQYGEEHFLHNGIIRNGAVCCYPDSPFPVITLAQQRLNKTPKSETPKKPKSRPMPQKAEPMNFTREQEKEISMCEKSGIDPKLIRNPKLSQSQMRVLWVAKSKGAMSEYFANPNLSTDAMKFYADRVFNKESYNEVKEMLAHPELGVDELGELYACVCEGIPYSDFIGMTASEIDVEREKARNIYWGSSSMFDPDYYDKAANVARKMKGF